MGIYWGYDPFTNVLLTSGTSKWWWWWWKWFGFEPGSSGFGVGGSTWFVYIGWNHPFFILNIAIPSQVWSAASFFWWMGCRIVGVWSWAFLVFQPLGGTLLKTNQNMSENWLSQPQKEVYLPLPSIFSSYLSFKVMLVAGKLFIFELNKIHATCLFWWGFWWGGLKNPPVRGCDIGIIYKPLKNLVVESR